MTRKEVIVKSLLALTDKNYFAVKTVADLTQVRQQSKLLGINVKSRNMNGTYVITLREKPFDIADYDVKPIGISVQEEQAIPMGNLRVAKYEKAVKHWESKQTPLGTSGITLNGLAYYEQGWEEIPEDWLVFEETLQTVFKPRYVKNPALLTNKLTRSLNLPDTKIMLSENYYPCEAVEADLREQTLDKVWEA